MSIQTDQTPDLEEEDMENLRLKLIEKEADVLKVIPRNSESDLDDETDDLRVNQEIEEIDYMIEMCQQKIRQYTITQELNEDTEESLNTVAAGMDVTEEELSAELAAVSKRLSDAKQTLHYVLATHYSEYQEDITRILMELEEASSAKEEENKYLQLSDDKLLVPILILTKAQCIVQHPSKTDFFKLAPLH